MKAGERARYGLAVVGGLLLAAAFPKFNVAGMAWVAPGMLLMAAMGWNSGSAFRIGYVGGMAGYLATLYWLLLIPVSFTPIIGWLGLALYLSVYPGVWVWLCWKMYPIPRNVAEEPPNPGAPNVSPAPSWSGKKPDACLIPSRFPELLDWFVSTPWWQRFGWTLFCASLWVGLEMLMGRGPLGFPWTLLGASQYRILPVIQIASVTGVYGVSFLVVWFSISLMNALVLLIRRPQVRWHAQRELLVPFLVTAAIVSAGSWKISQATAPSSKVKVALIQPSIPQTWIWDPNESSNRFQQLLQLSEQALTNHPDLLVWPEAAVPYMFQLDEDIHEAVTNLAQTHKIWLVLGSDDGEVRVTAKGRMETNYFNSSFLVGPDGEVRGNYRKRRLVMFGEYIPFSHQFSFIENLTGLGSFTPGDRPGWFSMPDLHLKAGISICFEDVFPHLTRMSVDDDTDFLLNLTNNGWFGESAAQWQHAADAVFRAVENGLPLVRCANNGLTCWVDAHGQMDAIFFPQTSDIYGVGYKIVEVPLLGGHKRPPTFYHRHGDWFGWGCFGLSGIVLLRQVARRRRDASHRKPSATSPG